MTATSMWLLAAVLFGASCVGLAIVFDRVGRCRNARFAQQSRSGVLGTNFDVIEWILFAMTGAAAATGYAMLALN